MLKRLAINIGPVSHTNNCSDLRSVTIHLQNYGPTSETLKHGHIRCNDFLIESCFRVHSSKISKQVNKCLFQTQMHPFCYKSVNTSTVKYRFNTDFKFHYCLSAFYVLKSAWHLCSNNYIAVLYKWLFIVRTLQFSIYYCITCMPLKNNCLRVPPLTCLH